VVSRSEPPILVTWAKCKTLGVRTVRVCALDEKDTLTHVIFSGIETLSLANVKDWYRHQSFRPVTFNSLAHNGVVTSL
jgi:hypothetical protein